MLNRSNCNPLNSFKSLVIIYVQYTNGYTNGIQVAAELPVVSGGSLRLEPRENMVSEFLTEVNNDTISPNKC